MNSREYWIKRAQHREAVSWSNGLEASAALIRVYKQTSTEIRRDINDFYMRYAGENGLSYEQAVREMSRPEMQEWKNSVEGYIREIQNCTDEKVRERLMREYDARSYNSRISRLEGLCGNINMNLDTLYQLANQRFREVLGDTFRDGYYKTLYDIQCRRGFNPFSTIDSEIVENALTYPWSGANFSDRLWKNKNALMDSLRETLTKGMIRGDNIREMSKNIAEKLNASYSNAERLILTESSHIHNTAELSAYEAAGYEQYEFMASPGEKTCEVCGELDGKRFKLSEKQYGVNFPPIHPRCRCTTIGFDPEDEEESDEQEKMSYEDWYRKYVKGREQPKLESKGGETKSRKTFVEVQDEYQRNATPNKGVIKFDEGFKQEDYPDEVSFAKWIHSTFGGDITVLAETKTCKMADYLWNGKLWDLKKPSTEKAVNGLLKKGLKQIENNPGGVFLDYGKNNVSLNAVLESIAKRMKWHPGKKLDIVIVMDGKVVKVLRYK